MGIIANSTGVDLSKYIPISKDPIQITNSATTDTYVTAYSISGKGFIEQVTMLTISYGGGIRIKIDGNIVYEGYTATSNKEMGILREKYKLNNTTNVAIRNNNAQTTPMSVKSYPYIDSTKTDNAVICLLELPIFFNSSLLIEMRASSASIVYPLTIKGGHL